MLWGPEDTEGLWMPDVKSRFDRWVESVYHRTRSRYHWMLIGATILSAHLLLAPLFVLLLGPLWTENVEEWPGILLIMEIATLAGTPALFWVVVVHHRTLISHLRGDPDVDPVTLWVTSVAELPKGFCRGLSAILCRSSRPTCTWVYVGALRLSTSSPRALLSSS